MITRVQMIAKYEDYTEWKVTYEDGSVVTKYTTKEDDERRSWTFGE